eukprot:scaffold17667_cov216-Amphora_coffeaeformis.AAC.5
MKRAVQRFRRAFPPGEQHHGRRLANIYANKERTSGVDGDAVFFTGFEEATDVPLVPTANRAPHLILCALYSTTGLIP